VDPDLAHAEWHKSTLSGSNGCVEVAFVAEHALVRDSKHPLGPMLSFTLTEWEAFIDGVRAGEFTHLPRSIDSGD
jgi:hypothetical protein